jgi:prepilin-type processing-associated H-X9-DG protein
MKYPSESKCKASIQKKFTILELLLVIAVIVGLLSILLPSLNKAKNNAYKIQCASNIKQIHLGISQYNTDYENRMPTPVMPGKYGNYCWGYVIASSYTMNFGNVNYVASSFWACPSYKMNSSKFINALNSSYGLNNYAFCDLSLIASGEHKGYVHVSAIKSPSQQLCLSETFAAEKLNIGYYCSAPSVNFSSNGRVSNIHLGYSNILYCDGHITSEKANDLNAFTWGEAAYKYPWKTYLRDY